MVTVTKNIHTMKPYTKKQLIAAIEILIDEYSRGINKFNDCSLCQLVIHIKEEWEDHCEYCINNVFGIGACMKRFKKYNPNRIQSLDAKFWTNAIKYIKATPFSQILPMSEEVKSNLIRIAEESYKQ